MMNIKEMALNANATRNSETENCFFLCAFLDSFRAPTVYLCGFSEVKTIPVIIELKNKKLSATINAYALSPPINISRTVAIAKLYSMKLHKKFMAFDF